MRSSRNLPPVSSRAGNAVETVDLVFKTHLDIGFTDLAAEVRHRYHEKFIPTALATAEELRRSGSQALLKWTTGSWLILDYLERADAGAVAALETAIAEGDISWHGLPFTTHSELMDASLFEAGLRISRKLDRRFGRNTISAKLSDVPGHTIGIVPLLAKAGVEFLHVGVNRCSAVPDVPPLFRWREPGGHELIVAYTGDYGQTVTTPDGQAVLHIEHSADNQRPPTPEEVVEAHSDLGRRYPNAQISASTLDAFAQRLLPHRDDLPVVESEIGDTWIHGVGSDPAKVRLFRELMRLRSTWLKDGVSEADLVDADQALLLVAEHTWGLDVKQNLGDWTNWSRAEFDAARATDQVSDAVVPSSLHGIERFFEGHAAHRSWRLMEESWEEQRRYLEEAVASLPLELRPEAEATLNPAPARPPSISAQPFTSAPELGEWLIEVSATGGLKRLTHLPTSTEMADDEHVVLAASYQRVGSHEYAEFAANYLRCLDSEDEPWALADFTKPGMPELAAATWHPTVEACARTRDSITIEMRFPPEAVNEGGAPPQAWLILRADEGVLAAEWSWFDKPANRLPEILWLHLPLAGEGRWSISKMGVEIDPADVVHRGNSRVHAVGDRVTRHGSPTIVVEPLDSPLIAFGSPRLLHPDWSPPRPRGGIHINLLNNLWGTNFPMWIEGDGKSRVRIRIEAD